MTTVGLAVLPPSSDAQQSAQDFTLNLGEIKVMKLHVYTVHVTALGVLCCFALFVCLTLLASFFVPSHLSFKNMYKQHPGAKVRVITREARYCAKIRVITSYHAVISRAHAAGC